MLVEESHDGFRRVFQRGEVGFGCKKGAGEGFIRRWERDEHELPPRPDMEVVWRDCEIIGVCRWLDLELAPLYIGVFLLIVHACIFHQVVSGGRVRAISADKEVEGDFDLWRSREGNRLAVLCRACSCWPCSVFRLPKLEPSFLIFEIRAGQLVVEEELYIWAFLELVEEEFVKPAAVNGVYMLGNISEGRTLW